MDKLDALGLAQAIRRGDLAAAEAVDAAIARLEQGNPALNAVVVPLYDRARRQAREPLPAGPFAGVPFLVKDLMVFIPDTPLTNGSRAFADFRPAWECDQARAIREAGFVVLGRTNSSELGTSQLTNPVAHGPTRNPWNLGLNAGGSSGGSAAAVAARWLPMASGSDGGGSIRIPASYCGVFGFKPGRGVNPTDSPRIWGGAVASHALSLTVRDSAAYLDWTSARRPCNDPDQPLPGSFLAASRRPPGQLRIGFCTTSPLGQPVHADAVAAVEAAAALLERLGHRVEPCPLPYGRDLLRAFLTVVLASMPGDLEGMGLWLGMPAARLDVEPFTRGVGELGRGVSPARFDAAQAVWRATAEHLVDFHREFDVLLTPVSTTPPLAHDALDPKPLEKAAIRLLTTLRLGGPLGRWLCCSPALLDQAIDQLLGLFPFTPLANATGHPAMAVPLHWNRGGLPIGVQFQAGPGRDALLFALAGQLEDAAPWRDRRPGIS